MVELITSETRTLGDPSRMSNANPKLLRHERGSQVFILQGVSTSQTQSGTAAPANAKVYGIVSTVSRGQMPYNMALQVDVSAGTFDGAASEIDILGSLDGVNFDVIDKMTGPDRHGAQCDEAKLRHPVAQSKSLRRSLDT